MNSYLGLRQKQGFEEEMNKSAIRSKKLGPHYLSIILRHEVELTVPHVITNHFIHLDFGHSFQKLLERDGRNHGARWSTVVPGR